MCFETSPEFSFGKMKGVGRDVFAPMSETVAAAVSSIWGAVKNLANYLSCCESALR